MDKIKKFIFLSSAKGKCSVSTNICLLATFLSSVKEKKVMVISLKEDDGCFEKLYFGRSENVKNQALLNNIGLTGLKRTSEIRTVDAELIEKYSVRINRFLHILPGFERTMSWQFIDTVLNASYNLFDYIFIDADIASYSNEKGFLFQEDKKASKDDFCTFICITQEENIIESGIKLAYSGHFGKKSFIVSRYDAKSIYNLSNIRKIMKLFLKEGKTEEDGKELVFENCTDLIFSISYDTLVSDYISSGNIKGLSKNFILMEKDKRKKAALLSEMIMLSDYIEEV